MTHQSVEERLLVNFLKELDSHVFVKTTDENFDGKESVARRDLHPVIEDQEAVIVIKGEWDREDLKKILSDLLSTQQARLKEAVEGLAPFNGEPMEVDTVYIKESDVLKLLS